MSLDSILGLIQTALELGLISSLTVLALFLSYSMLGVCDLSTDGCFTLGATVGAAIAIAGHPYLSIPAAMLAGMLSGLVTAVLQTKMGVNSLLSGIIINTEICEQLGIDFDKLSEKFAPYCTKVQSIVTAESFDDVQ